MKNTKIPFNAAFFLKLDSSDVQYKQPLSKPIKTYFAKYDVPLEESWLLKKSKGLSTRVYNFKDTTSIEDSLKTHPDCKDRYAKSLKYSNINQIYTPIPTILKEKANKMLIWNLFDNEALTACLYRILLEKDSGNKDEWYDFMVYNIFSGLYYADKELNRFNAIGITPKEYISKDYYELQNMFEQMPREVLADYCKKLSENSFWQVLPGDTRAFKSFFYALNFKPEASSKSNEMAAKEFETSNSKSMYREFSDHFKKK